MAHEDVLLTPHVDSPVEPAIYRCRSCKKAYCLDHASDVDPKKYCVNCAKPDEIDVIEFPLIDKEGVHKQGRMLRPIGAAFIASNKLINELSDDELKSFVNEYSQKLRDAELSKNFFQINLSLAQNVALERDIAKQNAKGEVYFPSAPERKTKPPRAKRDEASKIAEVFAKAGITPEMIRALIEKKKRESGAA